MASWPSDRWPVEIPTPKGSLRSGEAHVDRAWILPPGGGRMVPEPAVQILGSCDAPAQPLRLVRCKEDHGVGQSASGPLNHLRRGRRPPAASTQSASLEDP